MDAISAFLSTTFLSAVFASWLFVAPAAVGGPASYTIIAGNSMEPVLRAGDLALLRRADGPRRGDIIGYDSRLTGELVLHRITEVSSAGMRLKGDHNTWTDPEVVHPEQVRGRLWIRVPWLGSALTWLRVPWHAGVVTGLVVAGTAFGMLRTPRRRWTTSSLRPGDSPRERVLLLAAGPPGRATLGVLLGVAVVAGAVATFAFVSPTTRDRAASHGYRHVMHVTYTGPTNVPEDVTLPSGERLDVTRALDAPLVRALFHPLQTGDPVYAHLNPSVDIRFRYELQTDAPHVTTGTAQAYALVKDVNGWQQIFPIGGSQSFRADTVEISALSLRPRDLMEAIRTYQAVSGHVPRYYTAAVVFRVMIEGTLGGLPFRDESTHATNFRIVPPNEMYVETQETRLFDGIDPPAPLMDPFEHLDERAVDYVEQVPNTVEALGAGVRIVTIRAAAVAIVVLALLSIAGLMRLSTRAAARGADFVIRARYGEHLVLMDAGAEHPALDVVPVARVEDLVRLARINGSPIFVRDAGGRHEYLAREGEHFYSYAPLA